VHVNRSESWLRKLLRDQGESAPNPNLSAPPIQNQ
jgi:hypothetical protein